MKARHSISSASTHKTQSRHTDSSVARTPQIKYQAENFKTEFTHRLGFLGLKLILVGYNRHASVRLRVIIGTLTKLALNGQSGIQLWKFFDFLVTHRPPVFIHMLPFIRFKMAHLKCATPGEQAYQQIVSQKLIGLHHPVPQTTSSVLRDLMRELSAIQHDVQHFSQTRTKKSVTNTETKRRPNSVDRQYSIKKQTSRRNKLTLEEVPEHGVESERALKDKEQLANVQRIDVLASVTSESTCSVDALGEISIGLPSLSQSTRATRGVLQNFRQSILVRDPRKRIAAQEGSRMLLQSQTLKQRDPIMTASTESVNRPSRPMRKRKDRDRPHITTSDEAHVTRMLEESYFPGLSDRFDDSGSSDETQMTVGPAAAAAIATSLYGSEAPYLHARERARQELKALVGIPMPQVDMSTESLDSHSLDKSSTCECLTAIDSTDPTHLSAFTPWDNTSGVQQPELTHTETENDASNRQSLQSRINYV
ncbi:unnamed protein product [Dicrocoelium dendriticum]|nr:unnamed protein product [Dicrocoelium dendriticum]